MGSTEAVYRALLSRRGAYVSGQELGGALRISRAAVWKAVEALRREGYGVEASAGLGYRLVSVPDALTEKEIRRLLPKEVCPELRCFAEIDSTNSYLKREALSGAPHGTVAVADCQSAGRGRRERSFLSPAGKGVYLSVLLRPAVKPEALLGAAGMAAVAVCNAVERAAGTRPGIKWTNDLLLHGRKLCGILTELGVEGETGLAEYLVIGAGVNVRQTAEDFPPEVASMATSLALEGRDVSRSALAAAMAEELLRLSGDLGGDVSPWAAQYRRDCVTIGKDVRLLWTRGQERAFALDVDDSFGLVVRREDGTVSTVRTGEVSVRGLYGYAD